MNSAGIKTGWRVIQGAPDFFSVTKKMHNALQGEEINLSDLKKDIYEGVIHENAVRNHLDAHNMVIIHDPQPLPMILHYRKNGPWIWRCHLDLTSRNTGLWNYLSPMVEKYDAVVLSLKDYAQNLKTPQVFIMPAIDPFIIKNRDLSEEEMKDRLDHYKIPTDLPLVVQISRFDRWKDPGGVIEAFRLARKEVDCTLVLLGNVATDDPEGVEVYESLLASQEERIIILSHQDTALVNTLAAQGGRGAPKVAPRGIRPDRRRGHVEGNAGHRGQRRRDPLPDPRGENGFLVSSVKEAAERIVQVLKDPKLRESMGRKAKETVRDKFLMTRYLEQYLDLFRSFETIYRLTRPPGGLDHA